jgi:hypothetical protein
MELGTALLRGR